MSLDASILAHAIKRKGVFVELQAAGITSNDFVGDAQKVWRYLQRVNRDHGQLPSADQIERRYDWLELPETRKRDLPILLSELRKRRDYNDLIKTVRDGVDQLTDFDSVDEVRSYIIGALSSQMVRNGKQAVRDLFSREVSDEMMEELRKRREGKTYGLPTGLHKFDSLCGGMVPGRMITVIGRTGTAKTWLGLVCILEGVISGGTFVLYPLEMTLTECALRIYTMLSFRLRGNDHVLRNLDLQAGRITPKKVVKFLHFLEDHYKGQLYVADVGSVNDPYTVARIDAECTLYRPDGFWVDGILLLRPNSNEEKESERSKISNLSAGIKGVAQRHNAIGGSSTQVNRDALKSNVFLPRPEHIYNGDAIGHWADQIISVNRKGKYLFYGVPKNRHGPEVSKTRVLFNPDYGQVQEDPKQDEEEEE